MKVLSEKALRIAFFNVDDENQNYFPAVDPLWSQFSNAGRVLKGSKKKKEKN